MRPDRNVPVQLTRLAALGGPTATLTGGAGVAISGISLSSQRIRPGDLYAALPGTKVHGARFAGQALGAGALAVLTDAAGAAILAADGLQAVALVVPNPRSVLGAISAEIYGHPADRLRVLGVTGTQGKTTTSRMIVGALEAMGATAGVVGTLGTRIAGRDVATALTTPEATDLQALLAVMVERGVSDVAVEVSSHALVLGRIDGARCAVAGFTNLGRDHLDFHPTMEEYFAAKAELFTPARAARGVVCVDDPYGRRLVEQAQIPITTVAIGAGFAPGRDYAGSSHPHWQATEVVSTAVGTRARISRSDDAVAPFDLRVALPGAFNLANALVAVAICAEAGHDPRQVAEALGRGTDVPGRLEPIRCGQPFSVLVDYAHKPDALTAALGTLRPLTQGRLLLVVGAGGDRDSGKRPLMGEIGARLADVLIVTDDNPRSEDPARIRAEVLAGASGPGSVIEIGDRRLAIREAFARARPGDIVLIAGKGHETGQEVAGVITDFDDRSVAVEELQAWVSDGSEERA